MIDCPTPHLVELSFKAQLYPDSTRSYTIYVAAYDVHKGCYVDHHYNIRSVEQTHNPGRDAISKWLSALAIKISYMQNLSHQGRNKIELHLRRQFVKMVVDYRNDREDIRREMFRPATSIKVHQK